MSDDPHSHSTLYRFLDSARIRMEFGNGISAAGIAATWVCLVGAPFVAWRAAIGLRDGPLAVAVVISAATLFLLLAMRRSVRMNQVPLRLEIDVGDKDRVSTAAEFMGDDDPFKRLAVQQTEMWIDQEEDRLSEIKISRWPYIGAGAILVLILIWILTPGWNKSLVTHPRGLASTVTTPPDSSQVPNQKKSPTTAKSAHADTPVLAQYPGNNGGIVAANSAQGINQHGNQGGNSPSPNGSNGNVASMNNHPGMTGAERGQVSKLPSGGIGRGSAAQVPTRAPPAAPTVAVQAAQARATHPGTGREETIESNDMPPPAHAAPAPDVQFKLDMNSSELEELPPAGDRS